MHSIRPSPFLTAQVLAAALFATGFTTAQRDYAWVNNLAAPSGIQAGAIVADPTPGPTFGNLIFTRTTGTFTWNGTTSSFALIANGIGNRFAAISGVRLSPALSGLVAFGGLLFGTPQNTTQFLSTTPGVPTPWSPLTTVGSPPSARSRAAIGTSSVGVPVLFGGIDAAGAFLSDTWELRVVGGITTWLGVVPNTVPPARADASMCAIGGLLLMQGGRNAAGLLNDTWIFDGADWHNVTGAVRPAAGIGPVAFDAARNEVIHIDPVSGTTSRFNVAAGTWNVLPTANDPVSSPFASTVTGLAEYMAFDAAHQEHVFIDQSAGVAVLSPADARKVAAQPSACASPLLLTVKSGQHRIGRTYQMAVAGAVPLAGVSLFIGTGTNPPTPTPIAGSTCVAFFTTVLASTTATADPVGTATFSILVPNAPALIGAFFDHQAIDVLLNASQDIAVQLGR